MVRTWKTSGFLNPQNKVSKNCQQQLPIQSLNKYFNENAHVHYLGMQIYLVNKQISTKRKTSA